MKKKKKENLHLNKTQPRRRTTSVRPGAVDIDAGVVAALIHNNRRLGRQKDGREQPQRDGDVLRHEPGGHGFEAERDDGKDGLCDGERVSGIDYGPALC